MLYWLNAPLPVANCVFFFKSIEKHVTQFPNEFSLEDMWAVSLGKNQEIRFICANYFQIKINNFCKPFLQEI